MTEPSKEEFDRLETRDGKVFRVFRLPDVVRPSHWVHTTRFSRGGGGFVGGANGTGRKR